MLDRNHPEVIAGFSGAGPWSDSTAGSATAEVSAEPYVSVLLQAAIDVAITIAISVAKIFLCAKTISLSVC